MKRIIALTLLCLLAVSSQAQELALSIETNPDSGRPEEVVVTGSAHSTLWLGVSFYPYGTENLLTDGRHQVFEITKGKFEHRFKVGSGLVDGGVECALWDTRVGVQDCTSQCIWCTTNGYHLEGRRLYIYGSLARANTETDGGQ